MNGGGGSPAESTRLDLSVIQLQPARSLWEGAIRGSHVPAFRAQSECRGIIYLYDWLEPVYAVSNLSSQTIVGP